MAQAERDALVVAFDVDTVAVAVAPGVQGEVEDAEGGEGTGAAKVRTTPVAGSVTVIALSGLPSQSRGQRTPLTGMVGTPGSGTG